LPEYDLFSQNFSPLESNWLPFYWKQFRGTVNYTYRLEDLTDLEKVWHGFRSNVRREIRKAEKQIVVQNYTNIDRFIKLVKETFHRQGLKLPFTETVMKRLDKECAKRDARRILFAEDNRGRIHAALYLGWDQNTTYYLIGGGDPVLRTSGATSLLLWDAIQFSSSVSRVFDFEGSMIEPIERFFRSFGARQVPYLKITNMSRRMQILMAGRQFYRAVLGRNIECF